MVGGGGRGRRGVAEYGYLHLRYIKFTRESGNEDSELVLTS